MSKQQVLTALVVALLSATATANAQQGQANFPDGPGKQTFVTLCGACHDINRVRIGYTPEGWLTVMRMMLNFEVPLPKNEVDTVTQYLIKNFPERPRPAAAVIPGPVEAKIELWPVPTPGSRPHDPLATRDGAI
jgi:virginiamycin B lyase